MTDLSGQTVRGYELRELIGTGGFGAVYRAFQPIVGREVAIKIILPEYANQADFIRRFEVEAQLIARLEHLHIVPLYDYWREPSGAYLVMRWLHGGSLRGALRNGPLPLGVIARLLDQIAAALEVAHRQGVVHRDIKPDNILLDTDRNAYLADFGIAKSPDQVMDATETGLVIGSPAYITPEQVSGDPVGPQTDIYSLGVVLYELLTGEKPFSDTVHPYALMLRHMSESLPALLLRRPDLPQGIDHVIQKATAKGLSQRYSNAPDLAAAFRQELAEDVASPVSADEKNVPIDQAITVIGVKLQNPYKGLRAFQEPDAADFFGREALTEQLIGHVADKAHFVAVVGPSGSGKSSVVRAALLPALRQGRLPGSERWFYVEMLPGPHPLEELEIALLRIAANPSLSLLELLQQDERGLLRAVRQVLPDEQAQLVLFIDQFEEVFTLVEDEAARTHFLDSLLAVVSNPNTPLRVIITLRADFFDRPLLYPAFGELVRRRTEVVLPLSGAELGQAIVGPANRAGAILENGLVEAISRDVGQQPGALPLLQYALTELFERRIGNQLTLEAYRDSGGVLGALGLRAEELFTGLDASAQETARQLFLRLVILGEGTEDTRRRVQRAELSSLMATSGDGDYSTQAMETVIDLFARHRLLTFDRDPVTRSPTVEVAHEALIRTWTRLRGWLDDSRDDVRLHRRLTQGAAEWTDANRDPGFLATGARLDQFVEWAAKTSLALNQEERAYLEASIADLAAKRAIEGERKSHEAQIARRAQNFGRAAAVLAVVGVLAVIATVVAIAQASNAQAREAASVAKVSAANTQVSIIIQTLTPVPQTMTPVQLTVQAGSTRMTVANAQIAQAAATLSPIPPTLTAVAQRIEAGINQIESLRLAAAANGILQANDGNAETAALLGIRALKTAYSAQADTVLMQAVDRLYTRHSYGGHTDYVTSVAFAPDGKNILTGSNDKTARLWDVASGQVLRTFSGHADFVSSVAFAPDGNSILTGSGDTTARLWDVASGQVLRTFSGHTDVVTSVAFAPDGKTILTGSNDKTARLWDAASGQAIRTFTGHSDLVWAVSFAPDGRTILTGSTDTTARLWDLASGQTIRTFSGHTDFVTSVAFAPDGKTILTGSQDRTARLWEVASGQVIRTFTGHAHYVTSAAFAPDGKTIVTGSVDGTARIYDIERAQVLRTFSGHTDYVWSVAFAPDGKSVLTGSNDKTVRLWDVQNGQGLRTFSGHVGSVLSVAFAPDGRTFLTGSQDRAAWLWDVATGQVLRTFDGHLNSVLSVAFAPDGKTILTGSNDKTARLWDVASGQVLRTFSGHADSVSGVAFAPDGKTILTGSGDGTAQLWDVASGQVLRTFSGHTDYLLSVAFAPDGKTILTGSGDKTARLWDAQSGEVLRIFNGSADVVFSVAFAPDGKTILTGSGDSTARLWDVQSGQVLRIFSGHTGSVLSVAFGPDSKTVLTGSLDRTARLWDAQSGQILRTLIGHTDYVTAVAFAPDGKTILTGSGDRTAELWNTDYLDLIAYACTRTIRDLTANERRLVNLTDREPTCPQFARSMIGYTNLLTGTPTAIINNSLTTPMPPTSTAIPNLTLPVWTPIAPPTSAQMVTPSQAAK